MALQQIQDPRRKQTGPFAVAPAAAVPRAMAPNLPNQPSMLPTKIVRPPPIVGGGNPAAAMNPLAALGSLGGSGAGGGSPASNSIAASPVLRPGQASPDVNPQAAGTSAGVAARGGYKAGANTITDALNASLKGGAALVNHIAAPLRTDTGVGVDFVRGLVGADPRANAGQPFAPVQAPQLRLPYATAKPVNFAVGGEPTGPAAAAPAAATATTAPAAPQLADNISAGNLAAAQRFGTTAAPSPQIQLPATAGGVDIAASPVNPASHLPVGAMVNGVPTFSDGTGGIPRTMTDDQIKHYGDNLSRADVGAAGNVLASDVLGGATPTQEQMVAQRMAQIQRPITGSRPSAAQFAEADRNAIASRDPRSAAGTAARNLSIDAQYGGTPRLRRMAEAALANLQAGSQQSGLAGQQADAQSADTAATGRNALQAIDLQGQNQLANTALENAGKLRLPRAGTQVQLADGTLGIQDNITGAITRSTLPDGTVAKGQLKNPAPPIYTSAGGAASLKALTDNILGVDPNTGMKADPDAKGGMRFPTNEETFAAMQKAQGQLQQLGQPAAATQKAPSVGTVSGGYRFKGGDPAVQSNWEKV